MTGVGDRLRLPVTVLKIAATRPRELVDRLDGRLENKRQNSLDPAQREIVEPNREDPITAAHELLGLDECAACASEIAEVENDLLGAPDERHRFDGGAALVQILWVVVRHRRPEQVVETGVARGVSSAVVLEALERNRRGRLWSIDLPPLRFSSEVEIGTAVPDRLRHRWTYIRGASRRQLPPLLAELDTVDLFVHDGLHTPETMTFEFHHVLPYLADAGVIVADDANANGAFSRFSNRIGRDPLLVGETGKGTVVGLLQA